MKLFKERTQEDILMTEGNPYKKILFFMIPVFLGGLFQQLYNTVDALIVGNFVGPEALGAVSSTGPLVYIVIGFFNGFAIGAGIVIARHIGARDDVRTSEAVHTDVAMGLIFSVCMSVGGAFAAGSLLKLMQVPDDSYAYANTYLTIYYAGSFAVILYNIFMGILQAAGDSRRPLYYLMLSSLTNVVLDLLLIGVFKYGVGGAAAATVISQSISACLAFRRLCRYDGSIRVDVRKIRIKKEEAKRIIYYGFPTAMQVCVIDFSNTLIQSYINSFGSLAMAGIGAYSKLEGFSFLPINAFSMALSTFTSQNLGAGKYDRMRKGLVFCLVTGVAVTEITAGFLYFFAPQLLGLFTDDPQAITYGLYRAHICAWFTCLMAFSHIASAGMRGIGKPMVPMIVMLVFWCAVRVAVLFTIGQVVREITLVCWIYPITWSLSTVAYLIYGGYLIKHGALSGAKR